MDPAAAPPRQRRPRSPLVVTAAAAAAVLLRFPGLLYPIGADESGFTLVARAWDPTRTSVYGAYFVDRPPALIALIRVSDQVGGPLFLRVVAAAGCALLVLAAAATARQALRFAGMTDDRLVRRTGAWTALLTAAFTSNAMIDPVMAKGELLGIPFVVACSWLVLRAANRAPHRTRAAMLTALAGGLAGGLALGMKQNMVAGIVFGVLLLTGCRVAGRVTTGRLVRLLGAFVLGVALPVVATIGWALAVGVDLGTVWYAVYGFRSDALEVIATGGAMAPVGRAATLVGAIIATGMAFVVAGLVIHRRRIWRLDPVLATATTAILLVDLAGLVLGGSFWRPYLFVLVPDLVLCTALLLAVRVHVARRARVLIVTAAVVCAVSSAFWTLAFRTGVGPAEEVGSGKAIAAAAEPGDSIVVYGGRADLVLASGLDSPYRYLWSLPMRTLDPELSDLQALLAGPRAPTWLVMLAPRSSWDNLAEPIEPLLEERYAVHDRACGGRYVYLLRGEERAQLSPDCG